MGELTIRRNRGFAPVQHQEVSRAEKPSGGSESRRADETPGAAVSETLRQRMTGPEQHQVRESRRTLRTGEIVLDEVQDALERMAELARELASGEPDRSALQEELERLVERVDQIIRGASSGDARLFLDAETEDAAEVLEALSGKSAGSALPSWLLSGLSQNSLSPERILSALGLDKNASTLDILTALSGAPLESNAAAGRLAALYLGAVITARGTADALSAGSAAEGLRQLMEKVAQGVSVDEAVAVLTNGAFTGLADFQFQFTSGIIPGMDRFLYNLLLSGSETASLADAASLLPDGGGAGEMELEFLLSLLSAARGAGGVPEAASADSAAGADLTGAPETAAGADLLGAPDSAAPPLLTVRMGNVQVMGRDLSGVSYDEGMGMLTIGGEADVMLQSAGEEAQAIRLTGSGAVTLRNVSVSVLEVPSAEARIFVTGTAVLEEVRLGQDTSLTLSGGSTRLGALLGGSVLRLAGGAAVQAGRDGETPGTLTIPVVAEGPVLLAARAASVTGSGGKPMAPVDNLWKALLPGWSAMTSLSVNGQQERLALTFPDPARLWLAKGDPSQGSPIHTVVIRGRDAAGHPMVRYAYLHWNQDAGAFEELCMYPNPFTVTGGEPGRDWLYEEETQTLHILTDQVTAVSGGPGTDARQEPFSGRIALADGIGRVTLSLGGVSCRVGRGRAFHLGRENDVTLILPNGTRNLFGSGPGRAGVSLGDGTALTIERDASLDGDRTPPGALAASGRDGGAGIGRDSGAGRDQTSSIRICGGAVTASGDGGGAGIGAGKHGAMGDITITGGTVDASGSGGGAGVGGGLNAPVGSITIQGGSVTAIAASHAAAIGAGVQGPCGGVLITGTARVAKAQGGDPGADIGACLFGGCGEVRVSGGADIGAAKLRTRKGVTLQMGEDTVTLPQFRLSARALGLERLRVSTREEARAAETAIEAGRRWVAQIQEAYSALSSRMEQRSSRRFQKYVGEAEGPVRDTAAAGTLLRDMSRSIPLPSSQAMRAQGRQDTEDVRQLLR